MNSITKLLGLCIALPFLAAAAFFFAAMLLSLFLAGLFMGDEL
jgi:hypothetical protein